MSGRLSVVATPIGNLGDLSDRARETLAAADLVAAEDTRRTGRLLAHMGVKVPIVSNFTGNEAQRSGEIVQRIRDGVHVALVSDAGMPGVSDPGERLIAACIAEGFPVEVIPGPSAVLTALVLSGLPADRFTFEGFPDRTAGTRRARFAELAGDPRTMVFFESPRRAAATLREAGEAFGLARPAALCRELTKLHEEVLRGSIGEILEALEAREVLKGEVVIVIGGAPEVVDAADHDAALADAVADARIAVGDGSRPRAAAATAAARYGLKANAVYRAMTQG